MAELGPTVLRMGTTGDLVMETTYRWEPDGDGTRMRLRNRGEPKGRSWMKPVIERFMRSANGRDLRDLKALLEARQE